MNNTVWIELDKPFDVEDSGIVINYDNQWFKVLQADGNRVLCEQLDEISYE